MIFMNTYAAFGTNINFRGMNLYVAPDRQSDHLYPLGVVDCYTYETCGWQEQPNLKIEVDIAARGRNLRPIDVNVENLVINKGVRKGDIVDVKFSDPATIVFWRDGTKTVVKAINEPFDKEKGLAMAIAKKTLGNHGNYYNEFSKWIKEDN
jgi:hypothetical protein